MSSFFRAPKDLSVQKQMMKKQQKSAREIKEEKVAAIVEKVGRAKSLTFTDYHGLAAVQIAKLRAKIKEAGGEFLVEKNTLFSRALQDTKYKIPASPARFAESRQAGRLNTKLTGPTAAILAYEDEISPIREIAASYKELGFPTFKFGFLEKNLLDATQLEKLSKLPPKDQLRAQFVGSLAYPIYGFVNILSANIRNLVSVLDQASKLTG
ncbi:50S ribosomal protein L10 [Candidatus Curtissbacteria bacterium RIFCSPLOWO2_01_FULL_42_26]|uniref:Large ribosomal subunit protein uL10 n=1 Tax=Candidatus Curtissbacteria bacterium RIFCSPLOWO2_01_FULL_42_26 TaxID=1797729 RepID=A0A1F5I021_9BACT|nr:MAG: 50S ribosomal protein L10 [Candidatus Curtissbacteria bacterium RIFCSPLOWO2_01_FULL_42_26]